MLKLIFKPWANLFDAALIIAVSAIAKVHVGIAILTLIMGAVVSVVGERKLRRREMLGVLRS